MYRRPDNEYCSFGHDVVHPSGDGRNPVDSSVRLVQRSSLVEVPGRAYGVQEPVKLFDRGADRFDDEVTMCRVYVFRTVRHNFVDVAHKEPA